jgi:YD repeat-containing protein
MAEELPGSIDDQKRKALQNLFIYLSHPQPTLEEALGLDYLDRVSNTDQLYVKKVRRYKDAPQPEEVWLDDEGRWLRVIGYAKEETFTYDEEGYLIEATLSENAGQGWDRRFTYTSDEGIKRLRRLEVTRYRGAGSQDDGMLRGEQQGGIQVVNFDSNGNPDNLIPLWIYSD